MAEQKNIEESQVNDPVDEGKEKAARISIELVTELQKINPELADIMSKEPRDPVTGGTATKLLAIPLDTLRKTHYVLQFSREDVSALMVMENADKRRAPYMDLIKEFLADMKHTSELEEARLSKYLIELDSDFVNIELMERCTPVDIAMTIINRFHGIYSDSLIDPEYFDHMLGVFSSLDRFFASQNMQPITLNHEGMISTHLSEMHTFILKNTLSPYHFWKERMGKAITPPSEGQLRFVLDMIKKDPHPGETLREFIVDGKMDANTVGRLLDVYTK